MNSRLSDTLLSELSNFVARRLGLHFPASRWRDLERGLVAAAREFGFRDARACVEWLLASPCTPAQIETLAGHLTIGETCFFRDPKLFEVLETKVFPALLSARRSSGRRLSVWSAGCATGEEPYSLAIMLRRMLPDWKDWHVTMLGTDINPHFLRRAEAGVYGEWSFRGVSPAIRKRYFQRIDDGRYEVLPLLRQMVTFASLNLADNIYPSPINNTNAMDVILCRNVLMHFAPEQRAKVVAKLHRALVDGGWLIVAASETSQSLFSQFSAINYPGVVVYRKDKRKNRETRTGAEAMHPGPASVPSQRQVKPSKSVDVLQRLDVPTYRETLALYEQGRYAETEKKVIELLSAQPAEGRAMALMARVYADQGGLQEALEWCRKAIAARSLDPASHYLYATIQAEQGQVDEAVKSLKRALYLDPDFVLAHFTLGNFMQRQGSVQEATRCFENTWALLGAYRREDILSESGGLTAGRLREVVQSIIRPTTGQPTERT